MYDFEERRVSRHNVLSSVCSDFRSCYPRHSVDLWAERFSPIFLFQDKHLSPTVMLACRVCLSSSVMLACREMPMFIRDVSMSCMPMFIRINYADEHIMSSSTVLPPRH